MAKGTPEFFVKMLTDRGDLILDPFGGSNVTGQVCEATGRRWISCELDPEYVVASTFRFGTQIVSRRIDLPQPRLKVVPKTA